MHTDQAPPSPEMTDHLQNSTISAMETSMDEGQHTSLNDGARGGCCSTRLTREQPKSAIIQVYAFMYLCKKIWDGGLDPKPKYPIFMHLGQVYVSVYVSSLCVYVIYEVTHYFLCL